MNQVLIVQNITREHAGALHDVLEELGVGYDVANLDAGDAFPDPSPYKALVVLGGPDSANDQTEKMQNELAQIRKALDSGIPYLGVCLGLQTAVKAAGGKVVRAAQKEIGLHGPDGEQFTVALTDEGRADPLFKGLESPLSVFHLHGETVELTPQMTLLATGRHCRNQIVRIADKAYGIQSHFELTPEMLRTWAAEDPDLQPIGEEVLTRQFAGIQAEYARTGQILLSNFLRIAGLIQ